MTAAVKALEKIDNILASKRPSTAQRYRQIAFLMIAEPELTHAEVGRRVGLSEKSLHVSMSRIMDFEEMKQVMAALNEVQLANSMMDKQAWLERQQQLLDYTMETYTKEINGQPVRFMKDPAQANRALENLAKALGFYEPDKEGKQFTLIQYF